MSLLPSSDGFKRPAPFPEAGAKTSKSFSRSLDRSASAPALGSRQRSPLETGPPRAAKSVDSLPKCPAALGREEPPLTLPNLSDCDPFTCVDASLAGTEPSCSPSSSSWNTRAKPVAPGNPKPSCAAGSSPGLTSPPLGEIEGRPLAPRASTQAGGGAGLLPSSCLERSPTGPPEEELGVEQSPDEPLKTARPPGPSSAPGAKEGLTLGDSLQGGQRQSLCQGAPQPEPAPSQPPGQETLMEVEAADPAFGTAGSQPEGQSVGLSAGNAEGPVMEAESSQSDSSLAMELPPPGISAAVGFPGPPPPPPPPPPPEGQLSHPGGGGACPSLASALKELHQLLVVSYQKASWPESTDQPGTLLEEKSAGEEVLEGKQRHCPGRDFRDAELPPPEGLPECVHSDASAGGLFSGAGAEDEQETLTLPGEGALRIKGPLDLNSSIVPRPSVASCEPPGGECSEMSPLGLSSGQTAGNEALGQNQPPSSLMQAGESRSVLNFPPGEPGMPVSSCTNEPGTLHICSPDTDSAAPQPPVFPSVDIDKIVRAGFTSQEASEALERARGDVDLALLILLAKKIVVPT